MSLLDKLSFYTKGRNLGFQISDEIRRRNARRITGITLLVIIILVLYAAAWMLFGGGFEKRLAYFTSVVLGLQFAVLVLVRLGWVQTAAHLMLGGEWIIITIAVATSGGTLAPLFASYLLITMASIVFIGWLSAVLYTILTVITGYSLAILAVEGLLAAPFHNPMIGWITHTVVLTVMIIYAYIISNDMQQALVRTQRELAERRLIESQLREERQLLRTILDNIPDHIFVKDRDGRFILTNASLRAHWGEDIVGKTDFDLLPFYRAQDHQQEEAEIMATGVPLIERELEPLSDEPTPDWQLSNKIPLKDQNGDILAIVGINRIITKRKQMEDELRASEERYRIISELISDYAFAYNVHSDGSLEPFWITHGSFTRLTGYGWDEIGGSFNLYHPDDLAAVRRDVAQTIAQGEPTMGEYRILTKSGDIRWLSLARYPIRDANAQRVTRFYGAATDITERKRAEGALRESEARLTILNSIAHDISTLTDLNTTLRQVLETIRSVLPLDVFFVALCNPDVESITFPIMYDMGQFWEQEPGTLSDDSWVSRVIRTGQPLLVNRTAEEIASYTKTHTRLGDVGQVSASVLVAPLPLSDTTIGVISIQSYTLNCYNETHIDLLISAGYQIAIAVDNARLYDSLRKELATRQQAEAEIRQLNAELEQRVEQRTRQLAIVNQELEAFAYSISHDLRAPLRSIDGFSRMVMETNSDQLDDIGQRYLERIRAASQRMGDMIDALLTLSRVTRYELNQQMVNLSEMAQSIMDSLRETEPERRLQLHIEPDLHVHGDSRLLRIMLENLLGNAWKYTMNVPEASISFGQMIHDDRLVFFVRDNGAGFDPAYADKLFTVFQRLHSEDEFPGTGVGLATVQRIVRRHGGAIWAEANTEEGATFLFYF